MSSPWRGRRDRSWSGIDRQEVGTAEKPVKSFRASRAPPRAAFRRRAHRPLLPRSRRLWRRRRRCLAARHLDPQAAARPGRRHREPGARPLRPVRPRRRAERRSRPWRRRQLPRHPRLRLRRPPPLTAARGRFARYENTASRSTARSPFQNSMVWPGMSLRLGANRS